MWKLARPSASGKRKHEKKHIYPQNICLKVTVITLEFNWDQGTMCSYHPLERETK